MAVNVGMLNTIKKIAWASGGVLVASIEIHSVYSVVSGGSSGGGSGSPYDFDGSLLTSVYATVGLTSGQSVLKPGGKPQPIGETVTPELLANYEYYSYEPYDHEETSSFTETVRVADQAYFNAVRDNFKTDRIALIDAVPGVPIGDTAAQYFRDNAAVIWPGETIDPDTIGAVLSDVNPVTGGDPITISHDEEVTTTTHIRDLNGVVIFPIGVMRQIAAPAPPGGDQIVTMNFDIPEYSGGTGSVGCSLSLFGPKNKEFPVNDEGQAEWSDDDALGGAFMQSEGNDGGNIPAKSWAIEVNLTHLGIDAVQTSGPTDP